MTTEQIRRQNQKLIQQQQAQNAAVRAASQAPTQTAAQRALSAYSAPVATASATSASVGAVSPAKQSGGVANSTASSLPTQTPYQQAMNAYSSGYPEVNKLEPVNYDTVQYRGDVDGGFQEADDAFKQSWAQIQAAYNAGDEATARELINQLQGGGNFMGWYDDNGAYNGFVRGFGGAGNGSYQAMVGGKMAQSGNVDTDWWLTPQGNIMSGKPGDALADTGNTWSYADQRVQSLAPAGANTNAPGAAGLTGKIYRPSSAADPAQFVQTTQKTTQTAQQTAPQTTPAPQTAELVTDTRQLSAPEAYDPESDSLWQQYLSDYQGEKAPEWDETFDYSQTPEYQRYLAEWDRAQAPEYEGSPYDAMRDEALERAKGPFSYDLELDPVWQSYRKQYTREGRRASEDTLGQYAAMTGGMPSTAAMTAAQQAGHYYSAQMADKVPQLYQDAYQRYLNEYQKQLGLAGEYNQYGQQDYNRFRDRLGQWNTDRSFAYGAAQDAIGNRRTDYGQRYNQFQDALDQWNADRSFAYNAARDNQTLGRQQVEDQYGRYRDAVGDQRYDQEWAQQLREYADSQNWKAKDWEQYLREYDDKMSNADREFAYQQYRDAVADEQYAAKFGYTMEQDALDRERQARIDAMNEADWRAGYGDTRGAEALGVDTGDVKAKAYAYAADGSTYDIGSSKGTYFLQNAGAGQTMEGGDGSIWTKNADGTVTIQKNGKTFTYGTPAEETPEEEAPTASGSYRYSGSGSGTPNTEEGIYEAMIAAGIKTEGDAYAYLLQNGYNTTQAGKLSKYFSERLGGDQGNQYSADDIKWARDVMTGASQGKVDRNSYEYRMAMEILGWQGDTGGAEAAGTSNQSLEYGDIDRAMQNMANRGASWDEIRTELQAALKDKQITQAEYDALAEKYHGQSDNVPNGSQKHTDGRPQSSAFNTVFQQASTYNDRGDRDKVLDTLMAAAEKGKIHEYEIDIIMDKLGL